MLDLRLAATAIVFVVALYWAIGASYEIVSGARLPGIFGLVIISGSRPAAFAGLSTYQGWARPGN